MRLIVLVSFSAAAFFMFDAAAVSGPLSSQTDEASALIAGTDTLETRISFSRYARTETMKWRQRLRDAGIRAEANGNWPGHAVADELKTSWAQADTASRRLISVNAKYWTRSRADFEKASRALSASWAKRSPAKT